MHVPCKTALLSGSTAHSPPLCRLVLKAARAASRLQRRHVIKAQLSEPNDQGDPQLQEALTDMIRVQIGQERVKDFVAKEGEKLRQAAEEAKAEVDQLANLTKDRSNLAFDSATADINRLADEFEEQLRASREAMEADNAEFVDWEHKMAIKRSEGTFFQNLYRIKEQLPGKAQSPEVAQTHAAAIDNEMHAQEAEERAEAVTSVAQQQLGSNIRTYLFSFLSTMLSFTVVRDLLSESPSYGDDAFYVLLVIAMGVTLIAS